MKNRLLETGDFRRAPRLTERELVVNYWDGAAPAGRGLRDVSETGAYIYTKENWYAGTIVRLIFKGAAPAAAKDAKPAPAPTASVTAQVVRQGADGVAMEFLFTTKRERDTFCKFLASIPEQAPKTPKAAAAPTEQKTPPASPDQPAATAPPSPTPPC